MMIYLVALLTGVSAGLRSMTAPTAMSWAAYLGWLKLQKTLVCLSCQQCDAVLEVAIGGGALLLGIAG